VDRRSYHRTTGARSGRGKGMALAGFGTGPHPYANTKLSEPSDTRQATPSAVGHAVFGPVGTVADIGYF
jgi:hypothetical protein